MSRNTPTNSGHSKSNTPTNPGPSRSNMATPLGQPLISTTSPTPSPRRTLLPPPHLPGSPRPSRIVPVRMHSGGSDRDGSPNIGSPRRQTLLVSGFSPGSSATPLPSVAENSATDNRRITSPGRKFSTPTEQAFSSGVHASPGRSPRGLIPELTGGSRRNSSGSPALVSISVRPDSHTPRTGHSRLPSSRGNSGHASPNRTSRTVTPRGGSGQSTAPTPVMVQMDSASFGRQDSWTPDFDNYESGDDWTAPAGGILLDNDDENIGRSWTSIDAEEEVNNTVTFVPGQRFGEGLRYQGEVIAPAIGRTHGHDSEHPLRRGGSEMGMMGRNGPVGAVPTDGKQRQKKEYEIVRAAGSGSFAQVYCIREIGGMRREYALKAVARPKLSASQLKDQLHEATVHLSLPIHNNIVTLHETLQTTKWIFLLLEWCPGDDLFYWLEKNRTGRPTNQQAGSSAESAASQYMLSSSKYSSSVIPFSPGAMYTGLAAQHPMASSLQSGSPYTKFAPHGSSPYQPAPFGQSPYTHFPPTNGSSPYQQSPYVPYTGLGPNGSAPYQASPWTNLGAYTGQPQHHPHAGTSPAAAMIFPHHNQPHPSNAVQYAQTPPTPSLLSAFSANDLLRADRLKLIASMFSQMCESVAVCHENGISHRDIKPENFICCDSVELETDEEHQARLAIQEETGTMGPSGKITKRRVIVKLTDFGLATTSQASEDMMCGSKPYMSYECLNGHIAPSYQPAPADVWSLGVVLLNMIFHRACWNEPSESDLKFVRYLRNRRGYLMTQFTGIGNAVATFLANHVLCLDVGDRVSARDFGRWIRNLPDMIAGRAAVREMKLAIKDTPKDKGMFAKSPIVRHGSRKTKPSTSALTTTAPTASPYQGLSSLPPPSQLAIEPPPAASEPEPESSSSQQAPPALADPIDMDNGSEAESSQRGDESSQKGEDTSGKHPGRKKKRGARRKGKGTQAALAAVEKPSIEREAILAELADASQSLARDLSRTHTPRVDTRSPEHFPPLGTSDAQIADAKAAQAQRSKWWKEKLSFSSTSHNPQLAAFAQRVAEREAGGQDVKGGFGNWSAPAKMQDDHRVQLAGPGRPGFKQTSTMSTSGIPSQLSSFSGVISSATSSGIEEEPEEAKVEEKQETEEAKANEAEETRAQKAVQAATLLSSNMGSMGSFGQRPQHVPRHGPLSGKNMAKQATPVPIAKAERSKPKPAPVNASPSSVRTIQDASIVTPPPGSSAVQSPTSGPPTSTVPSLTHGSSTTSSTAPSANNSAPSAPAERPGRFKERVQVLGNILRGVNLSNKKE